MKSAEIILKVLLATVCLGGCLYQLAEFFTLYRKYETTVQISTTYPIKMCYPAFTICMNNRLRKFKFCDLNDRNRRTCKHETNSLNREIFQYIQMRKYQEILEMGHNFVPYMYKSFQKCAAFPNNSETVSCSFKSSFSGIYTSCRTYNYLDSHQTKCNKTSKLVIDLSFLPMEHLEQDEDIGAKIAIHDNLHIPDVLSDFVEILNEQTLEIHMKKLTTLLLPKPYRTNCTDYYKKWEANKDFPKSRENCIQRCIEDNYMKLCKCLIYLLVIPEWKFDSKCVFYNDITYDRACLIVALEESKFIDDCVNSCPLNCREDAFPYTVIKKKFGRFLKLNGTKAFSAELHRSQVSFSFMNNEHTVYEHQPKISDIEIFSYIGGYVGVWLGISLFSVFLQMRGLMKICVDRFGKRKNSFQKEKHSPVISFLTKTPRH